MRTLSSDIRASRIKEQKQKESNPFEPGFLRNLELFTTIVYPRHEF